MLGLFAVLVRGVQVELSVAADGSVAGVDAVESGARAGEASPAAVVVQFTDARPSADFPFLFATALNGQHFERLPGHVYRLYHGTVAEPDQAARVGELVLVDSLPSGPSGPDIYEVLHANSSTYSVVAARGPGSPVEVPASSVSRVRPTRELRREHEQREAQDGAATRDLLQALKAKFSGGIGSELRWAGPPKSPLTAVDRQAANWKPAETINTPGLRGPGGAELPAAWGKVAALRAALTEYPDAEYFLFIDTDSIVRGTSAGAARPDALPDYFRALDTACGGTFGARPFVLAEDEGWWHSQCSPRFGAGRCANGGAYLLHNTAAARGTLDELWRRAPGAVVYPHDQGVLATLANATDSPVAVVSPRSSPSGDEACHLQCMGDAGTMRPTCLLHHYCDDKGGVEVRAKERFGGTAATALRWLRDHSVPLPDSAM